MTATVEVIAMKFGIMTHYNPLKPTHDQNFDFFYIPRWRTAAVLNNRKIAILQQGFDRLPQTFA